MQGPFQGKIRGQKIIVTDKSAIDFLSARGYGLSRETELQLDLIEAAYLTYRGLLVVEDEKGGKLSFSDLLSVGSSYDPDFWIKLNVYTDLRNRALVVMPGVSKSEFLVDWKKKDGARRFLVRILHEGSKISFSDFEEMHRRALESDRELVVAIVDKEGVITYYTVEGVVRVAPIEAEDYEQVQSQQEGQERASGEGA
ncbi:MAG: hypothetical protein QXI90_06655 [Thermofilum sp.]